jgi:hypothetical protein
MFEALKYYQNLAERFQGQILLAPGMVIVLIGLCIWLAGLRWRKILGAIVGCAFFTAIVLSFINYGPQTVFVAVIAGAAIGTVADKAIIGIAGTAAFAMIVLVILSVTLPKPQDSVFLPEYSYPRLPEYERNDKTIPAQDAIKLSKEMVSYFCYKATDNIKTASVVAFAAAIVTLLVAGFAAFAMPRIFIAVVSSSLGSAVIFAGMVLLLFYKGSKPVNCIAEKDRFYIMVLAAMTVFGALVQLILSPAPKKEVKKEKQEEPETEGKWR